jgi:NhaA family Na+:H+ antiporter
MSIFVADLAFINSEALILQAKIGILTASLLAGTLGYLWLRFIAKPVNT